MCATNQCNKSHRLVHAILDIREKVSRRDRPSLVDVVLHLLTEKHRCRCNSERQRAPGLEAAMEAVNQSERDLRSE